MLLSRVQSDSMCYVVHNLSQQCTGRVAQKEFNHIARNSKIELEDQEPY